jgi:hypothetical protein
MAINDTMEMLAAVADELDELGLHAEANVLTDVMVRAAQYGGADNYSEWHHGEDDDLGYGSGDDFEFGGNLGDLGGDEYGDEASMLGDDPMAGANPGDQELGRFQDYLSGLVNDANAEQDVESDPLIGA